jgi:hypothetical protein
MKSAMFRMLCRLLALAMLSLSMQSAQAGMVATGQLLDQSGVAPDRAALLEAVNRPEVAAQMRALGVEPEAARARVAAMTAEEVSSLAGGMHSLPAGAVPQFWAALFLVVAAVFVYNNYK